MISDRDAVLRTGRHATPEHLAAAVDRHDRATNPDRLRDHHARARAWSPGHHAHVDHQANLRILREHPDHVAALQEIAQDQITQAQQAQADYAWQVSARRAQAAANLERLAAMPVYGFQSSWYGLPGPYRIGQER